MADKLSDDLFGSKPDATKELLKTKRSSNSTRMEYLRMKSEQAVVNRQSSLMHEDPENADRRTSLVVMEEVIKEQQEEPEVSSFPFIDSVDGVSSKNSKKDKAIEANNFPGHKHGAKLCMMSAMVQMKRLADRRAKSIKQLRRNNKTTLDTKNDPTKDDSDDSSDGEEDGPLGYLKNCRYLRGVEEDKELSVEDIFG